MDDVDIVRAYHQRSKHQLQRYAAGPESLDWDAQPNPWRRYAGATVEPLPLAADDCAATWPDLFQPGASEPWAMDRRGLGALLQISLGLSAWKTQGPDRWALRCNPSSGNLHPTEAYALARGVAGLADGLYHYAPRVHALERRASLTPAAGTAQDAPGLWIDLTDIHWREAWKYGERAFRYCQLDLGHALGALRYAAATLGWRLAPQTGLDHATLARLLGLDRDADFALPPDLTAWLCAQGFADPHQPAAFGNTPLMHAAWKGEHACLRLLRAASRAAGPRRQASGQASRLASDRPLA